ncbi:hypothetical protein [Geothrix sp. 21YS21S-2]|uniref:hypothetical protein n=1 Tax=Geothrix sp. 21YS21S-2 TaxID=3068893 RepID=UPI0027B931D9|nr:hypothetical protein [Geothrix sp. 21YS21S-2]
MPFPPAVTNLVRPVLILLPLTVGTVPAAADHVVTLKDGRTLTVRTRLGAPVHCNNEFIKIIEIAPSFGRAPNWRTFSLSWAFEYDYTSDFDGIFSISMPGTKVSVNSFITRDRPTVQTNRNEVFFRKVQILEQSENPDAWSWIDEPGDSWIPFRITASDVRKGKTLTYDDCARVTETAKHALRRNQERIRAFEADFQTREWALPDGTRLAFRTRDGSPLRHASRTLQIDGLAPTASLDPSTGMPGPPYWFMVGRYRGGEPITLSLTAPWIDPSFKHVVKVQGEGVFTVRFAPRSTHPGFWSWVESPEDSWLPIKVSVKTENAGVLAEFVEVAQCTEAVRDAFRKR